MGAKTTPALMRQASARTALGGGGPFTAGDPANSIQLGVANATALGAGPHTLTLAFNTNCTGSGQHGSHHQHQTRHGSHRLVTRVVDSLAVGGEAVEDLDGGCKPHRTRDGSNAAVDQSAGYGSRLITATGKDVLS